MDHRRKCTASFVFRLFGLHLPLLGSHRWGDWVVESYDPCLQVRSCSGCGQQELRLCHDWRDDVSKSDRLSCPPSDRPMWFSQTCSHCECTTWQLDTEVREYM